MSGDDNPPESQLPAQVIAEFVENQRRELEIRAAELQLKAQTDHHTYEHAGKVLEAQERDRVDERRSGIAAAKHRYIFIAAVVLLAVGFIALLASMEKDQLALEIVRAVVYLSAGAIGGFFYGRNKGRRDDDGPDSGYSDS